MNCAHGSSASELTGAGGGVAGYLLPDHQQSLDICVGGLQGGAGLDQRAVQLLQGLAHLLLPERQGQELVHLVRAYNKTRAGSPSQGLQQDKSWFTFSGPTTRQVLVHLLRALFFLMISTFDLM